MDRQCSNPKCSSTGRGINSVQRIDEDFTRCWVCEKTYREPIMLVPRPTKPYWDKRVTSYEARKSG